MHSDLSGGAGEAIAWLEHLADSDHLPRGLEDSLPGGRGGAVVEGVVGVHAVSVCRRGWR